MKKKTVFVLVIGAMILLVVLSLPSLANATIVWDHWFPLTVMESITDIGNGDYQYKYSLVNVDTSPIWGFAIYTNFVTQAESTFAEYPFWGYGTDLIDDADPEYDARNLYTNIVMFTGTSCFIGPGPEIQVGETASGFSFIASTYDPSPKYYFYETIELGYTQTNGTGNVAAVGLTVPEPGTIALLGLGALLLRRRRK